MGGVVVLCAVVFYVCGVLWVVVACVVWCEVHRWAADRSLFLVCEDCELAMWVDGDRKVEVLPWWPERVSAKFFVVSNEVATVATLG